MSGAVAGGGTKMREDAKGQNGVVLTLINHVHILQTINISIPFFLSLISTYL